MATVYLAHDPRFRRDVALKVLPREFLHDPTFHARFEREAQTIATLEHPAIVPVYDFGEEDGQPYLVMRYMPGGSLADRLRDGPLSIPASAIILERVGEALDEAHAAGVIHRDLKPDNILFDKRDNAYLADFGIVKLASATASFTGAAIIGTPAYMSPEQARGDMELDGRSDIYALGAILFEMLSGSMPYEADTPMQLAIKHIIEPVPRILERMPALPPECDTVIKQAMAKERDARYPTGQALANAVRSLSAKRGALPATVAEPVPTTPETFVEPAPATPETVIEPPPRSSSQPQPSRPTGVKPPSGLPDTTQRTPPANTPSSQKPARSRSLLVWGCILGILVVIVLIAGVALGSAGLVSLVSRPTATATSSFVQTATGTRLPVTTEPKPLSTNTLQPQPTATQAQIIRRFTSELSNDIAARGVVRIGVRSTTAWPLTVRSGNDYSGFEIDLAREIVDRLYGGHVSIEWTPLNAVNRFLALQAGDIDILIRATTHTRSSEDDLGLFFTSSYFLDGTRLLVRQNSNVSDIGDLDGRTVGVTAGTTTELVLTNGMRVAGVKMTIDRYNTADEAYAAFVAGRLDAIVSDWSHLLGLSNGDSGFQVVGDLFPVATFDSSEAGHSPLAIGIPPKQQDFRDEVDGILRAIISDGSWEKIYESWLPGPHPWTVEEMLAEPRVNR